jgi:predicted proteasome-type protease
VGPPHDIAIYRADSFGVHEVRVEADSPLLGRLREMWERLLLDAVDQLPNVSEAELEVATASG